MPLYRKMKSPLGYQNLTNSSLDSYGVDHSGFTTRDELEYQFARQERDREIKTRTISCFYEERQ